MVDDVKDFCKTCEKFQRANRYINYMWVGSFLIDLYDTILYNDRLKLRLADMRVRVDGDLTLFVKIAESN